MNKVILIGNVGKDPDVRYYEADQAVAQFTLATSERGYTLPNGTQVPERTDWHNIVLWKGLAKIAEKYVHKGDRICIEGRIRYRTYDDPQGRRRYITEIFGENMEILTSKPSQKASTSSCNEGSQSFSEQKAEPEQGSEVPF